MTSQRSLNEKLIAETRAKVEQEIADWLSDVFYEGKLREYQISALIRHGKYRKETT